MAEKAPWENDGLRYQASLQNVTDVCCYKDFFESEKLDEAKKECDEAAERSQRSAVVYDRKLMTIVHRKVIEREKKSEEKNALPPKRGKKPVIERRSETKKKITNDDYFD